MRVTYRANLTLSQRGTELDLERCESNLPRQLDVIAALDMEKCESNMPRCRADSTLLPRCRASLTLLLRCRASLTVLPHWNWKIVRVTCRAAALA